MAEYTPPDFLFVHVLLMAGIMNDNIVASAAKIQCFLDTNKKMKEKLFYVAVELQGLVPSESENSGG